MNGLSQADPFFIDTNIFVYSFDSATPQKQQIAQQLIQAALQTRRGIISTQIVQEFLKCRVKEISATDVSL